MVTLKARVRNGRLVVDEPCELPEGTELDLALAEDEDELDDAERAALHAALEDSWASARRGETRPAELLIQKLRSGR
jgi:hypothetical protein